MIFECGSFLECMNFHPSSSIFSNARSTKPIFFYRLWLFFLLGQDQLLLQHKVSPVLCGCSLLPIVPGLPYWGSFCMTKQGRGFKTASWQFTFSFPIPIWQSSWGELFSDKEPHQPQDKGAHCSLSNCKFIISAGDLRLSSESCIGTEIARGREWLCSLVVRAVS